MIFKEAELLTTTKEKISVTQEFVLQKTGVNGVQVPQTAPKAIRRGPTHMTAKVGKILVALVEHRRPRFGDG